MTLALYKVRNVPMANLMEEQEVHLVAHGTSGSISGGDTSRYVEGGSANLQTYLLYAYQHPGKIVKSRTPENEKGVLLVQGRIKKYIKDFSDLVGLFQPPVADRPPMANTSSL